MSDTSKMDPMDLEGGNTITPSRGRIRSSLAKNWCFTWNNYPSEWMDLMDPKIRGLEVEYVIGQEVGEQGTPHLQGYLRFKSKLRPIETLKWNKSIHWEVAKGNKQENITYCIKEGKYKTNMKIPRPIIVEEPYGWQLEVSKIVDTEPDKRTVHWVWEPDGGKGKSSLVRYLCYKKGGVVCSGKASDMKHMIVKYHEKNEDYPDLVIFDVPRSSKDYLSYTGIEEIKNGCFASSKYETDMVIMPHPHVIVFANFPPDLEDPQMSIDRFKIYDIRDFDPQRSIPRSEPVQGCAGFYGGMTYAM